MVLVAVLAVLLVVFLVAFLVVSRSGARSNSHGGSHSGFRSVLVVVLVESVSFLSQTSSFRGLGQEGAWMVGGAAGCDFRSVTSKLSQNKPKPIIRGSQTARRARRSRP